MKHAFAADSTKYPARKSCFSIEAVHVVHPAVIEPYFITLGNAAFISSWAICTRALTTPAKDIKKEFQD